MVERETGLHKHARAPAMGEALVSLRIGELQRRDNEIIGPRRQRRPSGLTENRRGMDERGDHEPVPIGENFVVKAGADALFPRIEEFLAQRRKPRFVFCESGALLSSRFRMMASADHAPIVPISKPRRIVELAKEPRILRSKQRRRFRRRVQT